MDSIWAGWEEHTSRDGEPGKSIRDLKTEQKAVKNTSGLWLELGVITFEKKTTP